MESLPEAQCIEADCAVLLERLSGGRALAPNQAEGLAALCPPGATSLSLVLPLARRNGSSVAALYPNLLMAGPLTAQLLDWHTNTAGGRMQMLEIIRQHTTSAVSTIAAAPVVNDIGGGDLDGSSGKGYRPAALLLLGMHDADAAMQHQALLQLGQLGATLGHLGGQRLRQLGADLSRTLLGQNQHRLYDRPLSWDEGNDNSSEDMSCDGSGSVSDAGAGAAYDGAEESASRQPHLHQQQRRQLAAASAKMDWALRFTDPRTERCFAADYARSMQRLDVLALPAMLLLAAVMWLKGDARWPVPTSMYWLAACEVQYAAPLALLLMPHWRPLYLAHRDHLMAASWVVSTVWMCLNSDLSPVQQPSHKGAMVSACLPWHNAISTGSSWLVPLSLFLHARFAIHAPLVVAAAVCNTLYVAPRLCAAVYSNLHLPSCMARLAAQVACHVAVALLVVYALEMRRRHAWLQRRQVG